MKKSLPILAILLFFFLESSKAQKVYQWYQDGKVVFQTKVSQHIKFPPADLNNFNSVDFSSIDFIKGLAQKYNITRFVHLHPELTNDPLLLRTYQLEFENITMVDELIAELAQLSFIEYAEKKELHVKFLTPNDLGPQTGTNSQWG